MVGQGREFWVFIQLTPSTVSSSFPLIVLHGFTAICFSTQTWMILTMIREVVWNPKLNKQVDIDKLVVIKIRAMHSWTCFKFLVYFRV